MEEGEGLLVVGRSRLSRMGGRGGGASSRDLRPRCLNELLAVAVPAVLRTPSACSSSRVWGRESDEDATDFDFAALPPAMSLPQQILELEAYQHDPSLPEELTTRLYAARQALRANPSLKSVLRLPSRGTPQADELRCRAAYGSDPALWTILEKLWDGHATLLVSGDSTVLRPLTSLASLLASLCAATPGNQLAAL